METDEQKQVEREKVIDDSEVNAGIHTFQEFLYRPSYTFTLNQDPTRKTEISFSASRQRVLPSIDSKKPEIACAIEKRTDVGDTHGSLEGSSSNDIDHIFSGSKDDLENHLILSSREDRKKTILRELQSEAQWRARSMAK